MLFIEVIQLCVVLNSNLLPFASFSMYTATEVAEIKEIKFSDVLKAVTKIRDIDVQPDVFTWSDGKRSIIHSLIVLSFGHFPAITILNW